MLSNTKIDNIGEKIKKKDELSLDESDLLETWRNSFIARIVSTRNLTIWLSWIFQRPILLRARAAVLKNSS